MSQLQNKFCVTLCAILFLSCGFIDLRQIEIGMEPAETDSVLAGQYSPVIIKFDTEMIKNETEGILQINSELGAVSGDKIWKGNHLYFIPVNGWTAGIRYTMSLAGSMRAADGREARIERFISFYAINKNEPPLLEWHSPSAGASVGTNFAALEFCFSRSMDRLSAESAFSIDGGSGKSFEWSDDNRILKVKLEKALSPWLLYQWNIKDSAKSADGVPLAKTYSGFFTTDFDQTLPAVTRIYPVQNADGTWYQTGLCIETGLGLGQGIAVEFSKPMGENVLRSLRFEPSLSGRAEFLSDKSIVYIFSKEPEGETEYTLTVSGDAKDSEGLKLGEEHKINFIPDIPYLKVLSLRIDDNVFYADALEEKTLKIHAEQGTGNFNLSIHFSLMFSFEEKQNTPQRIILSPFFPGILAPVAVQYVNWVSDDRLFIRWEGLTASQEVPHYYRLTIPGGKGGISSETGIYMKNDSVFYLEAVR